MRTGTIISLGASAVLGIGALIVARVWLPQPGRAPADQADHIAVQTVPMVVASGPIAYGARLDATKLTVVQAPPSMVPQGAYASPSQIINQAGGAPIALTALSAREPVLPSQLSGAGARPTVAAVITEGMRAYTIGVTDVAGVGGHVLPGDRVDVVMTQELPVPAGQAACNCKHVTAAVVLQDVRVLGIDLNADPTSTQAAVAHTATLEVSVQDAQKLAVAAQAGSLSLALRRTGSAEVTPTRLIGNADLHAGALRDVSAEPRASARRPHGRSVVTQVPVLPALPRTHSVTVVHGDASSNVEVPQERFGAGA